MRGWKKFKEIQAAAAQSEATTKESTTKGDLLVGGEPGDSA